MHDTTDVNPPDGPGTESVTAAQLEECATALVELNETLRLSERDLGEWLISNPGVAFLARHQLPATSVNNAMGAWVALTGATPDPVPPASLGPVAELPPEPGDDLHPAPAVEVGEYAQLVALLEANNGHVKITDKRLTLVIKAALGKTEPGSRLSKTARAAWIKTAAEAGVCDDSSAYVSLPGMRHQDIPSETPTPAPVETPTTTTSPAAAPVETPVETPTPDAPVQLVVYIDCMPVGFATKPLDEVLGPIYTKVATREKVHNYMLVDYGKGPGMVVAEASAAPAPQGTVSVSSAHPLAKHLRLMWPSAQYVVAVR